jgi:hypothetical protein
VLVALLWVVLPLVCLHDHHVLLCISCPHVSAIDRRKIYGILFLLQFFISVWVFYLHVDVPMSVCSDAGFAVIDIRRCGIVCF